MAEPLSLFKLLDASLQVDELSLSSLFVKAWEGQLILNVPLSRSFKSQARIYFVSVMLVVVDHLHGIIRRVVSPVDVANVAIT